jgi:hypothetical protein
MEEKISVTPTVEKSLQQRHNQGLQRREGPEPLGALRWAPMSGLASVRTIM